MPISFDNLNIAGLVTGSGIQLRKVVKVATTANGTLATDFENGDTIDGITLATNDRILLKNQTSGTENGIYIVQASGAPSRSTDMQGGDSVSGVIVIVSGGTVNTGTLWIITNTDGSDVIDTNSINVQQLSSINDITGPSSSTDTAIAKFNGTTGKIIQNSGVLISAGNAVTGMTTLNMSGTLTNTATTNQLILSGPTRTATISAVEPATSSRVYTIPDAGANDAFTFIGAIQTLTNKTLTLPKINDTSSNNTYTFAVNELTADRTVTLPLLTGNDTFVFNDHTQTLTNKTITATTNTVRATELATTGASVVISGAGPPSANYVLRATTATTATWQNMALTFAIIWDEKTTGTAGGTATASTWTQRDLNQITTNAGSDISLASNQITLIAGTYFIHAMSVGHRINNHMVRIQNTTDATTVQQGLTARSQTADSTSTHTFVSCYTTITSSKVFQLQHNCVTTRATDGFGNPAGIAGVVEIYSMVSIIKLN